MKIYNFLSGIAPSRKKYALKFFLVASPLIILCLAELVIFIMINKGGDSPFIAVFAASFVVITILVSIAVLYFFNQLLSPLREGKQALDDYVTSRKIPNLPVDYEDEAGLLLSNIQAAISQLDKLITEKSDMIDLLSHDLRSPVGRILSLSQLIKADDSEKDLYADYITNECTGLLSMLENILLILKEDNHVFKLEYVSLSKLMEETLSFFNFAIAEKNLSVDVSIDEAIYIPIQQQLFKQAIRNILGNAIKFSPDGKTITITGKQNIDEILLCIRDEGLGFKPVDIQKIFDRFTTAGKKGTHGEASTGLGLYLSKKIVEKHGGKLLAESEGANMGASFTFVLYKLIIKKPAEKTMKKKETKTLVVKSRR